MPHVSSKRLPEAANGGAVILPRVALRRVSHRGAKRL
jgi:hypothetical protein